jgi:hypothetical protein
MDPEQTPAPSTESNPQPPTPTVAQEEEKGGQGEGGTVQQPPVVSAVEPEEQKGSTGEEGTAPAASDAPAASANAEPSAASDAACPLPPSSALPTAPAEPEHVGVFRQLAQNNAAGIVPPGLRITSGDFRLGPVESEILARLFAAATQQGIKLQRQQDLFAWLLRSVQISLGE